MLLIRVSLISHSYNTSVFRICSDIWSLGLTLCELAIGRFPLASSSEALQSVMQRISTGNVDVSDELRSEGCAADFCDVVLNW